MAINKVQLEAVLDLLLKPGKIDPDQLVSAVRKALDSPDIKTLKITPDVSLDATNLASQLSSALRAAAVGAYANLTRPLTNPELRDLAERYTPDEPDKAKRQARVDRTTEALAQVREIRTREGLPTGSLQTGMLAEALGQLKQVRSLSSRANLELLAGLEPSRVKGFRDTPLQRGLVERSNWVSERERKDREALSRQSRAFYDLGERVTDLNRSVLGLSHRAKEKFVRAAAGEPVTLDYRSIPELRPVVTGLKAIGETSRNLIEASKAIPGSDVSEISKLSGYYNKLYSSLAGRPEPEETEGGRVKKLSKAEELKYRQAALLDPQSKKEIEDYRKLFGFDDKIGSIERLRQKIRALGGDLKATVKDLESVGVTKGSKETSDRVIYNRLAQGPATALSSLKKDLSGVLAAPSVEAVSYLDRRASEIAGKIREGRAAYLKKAEAETSKDAPEVQAQDSLRKSEGLLSILQGNLKKVGDRAGEFSKVSAKAEQLNNKLIEIRWALEAINQEGLNLGLRNAATGPILREAKRLERMARGLAEPDFGEETKRLARAARDQEREPARKGLYGLPERARGGVPPTPPTGRGGAGEPPPEGPRQRLPIDRIKADLARQKQDLRAAFDLLRERGFGRESLEFRRLTQQSGTPLGVALSGVSRIASLSEAEQAQFIPSLERLAQRAYVGTRVGTRSGVEKVASKLARDDYPTVTAKALGVVDSQLKLVQQRLSTIGERASEFNQVRTSAEAFTRELVQLRQEAERVAKSDMTPDERLVAEADLRRRAEDLKGRVTGATDLGYRESLSKLKGVERETQTGLTREQRLARQEELRKLSAQEGLDLRREAYKQAGGRGESLKLLAKDGEKATKVLAALRSEIKSLQKAQQEAVKLPKFEYQVERDRLQGGVKVLQQEYDRLKSLREEARAEERRAAKEAKAEERRLAKEAEKVKKPVARESRLDVEKTLAPRLGAERAATVQLGIDTAVKQAAKEYAEISKEVRAFAKANDLATDEGKKGYKELEERLQSVKGKVRSIVDATTQLKVAAKEGFASYAQIEAGLAKVFGATGRTGVTPLDALQARFVYGGRVVEEAGGAPVVARNARGIARENLPYAVDFLSAQQASLREQIDVMMATSDGSKRAQQDLSAARKQAQEYGDALRNAKAQLRGHNEALHQASNLLRMFFRYSIGYAGMYQGLYAITGLIRNIADLDAALISIRAVTQATNADMRTIESTIKSVATSTKFTTIEIAKAGQIIGQAGVDAKEFPSALPAIAQFAAATESSLEISADLFSSMKNVFSEMEDMTIANQLTRAVNISKLTAEDLKTILSLSLQMSKAYNLSSEQYLGAVTTLRNAGIKASTVATGLRQALIEVFAPDNKTLGVISKRYEELGERFTTEQIRSRFFGFTKQDNPLVAVIGELRRIGYGGSGEKTFGRTFDVRAENALKALVDQFEQLQAAESRITFGSAALEGSVVQMEAVQNSLKNLGAAISAVSHDMARDVLPVIDDMLDGMTNLVIKLRQVNEEMVFLTGSGLGSSVLYGLMSGAIAAANAPPTAGLAQRFFRGVGATVVGAPAAGTAASATAKAGAPDWVSSLAEIAAAVGAGYLFSRGKGAGSIFGRRGPPVTGNLDVGGFKLIEKLPGWLKNIGGVLAKFAKGMSAFNWISFGILLLSFISQFDKVRDAISGFFTSEKPETREKKRIANRVSRQAAARERALTEFSSVITQVDAIRPTGGDYKAQKGSVPDVLEEWEASYKSAQARLDEVFAGRTKDEIEALRRLISSLATTDYDVGGVAFKKNIEAIESLLGTDIAYYGITEKDISELSKQIGRVNAQGQGFATDLLARYQRLADATELDPVSLIEYTAYQDALSGLGDIRRAIQQGAELTTSQVEQLYAAVLAQLRKVTPETWAAAYEAQQKELQTQINNSAVTVLEAFEASARGIKDIDAAYKEVNALVDKHGDDGVGALESVIAELEEELTSLDSRLNKAGARASVLRNSPRNRIVYERLSKERDQRAQVAESIREALTDAQLRQENARRKSDERAFEEANKKLKTVSTYLQDEDVREEVIKQFTAGVGGKPTEIGELILEYFNKDLSSALPDLESFRKLQAEVDKLTLSFNSLNDPIRALDEQISGLPEGQEKTRLQAARSAIVKVQEDLGRRTKEAQASVEKVRTDERLVTRRTDQQSGNVYYEEAKPVERVLEAVSQIKTRVDETKEQDRDLYVEGEAQRAMRNRIYELELNTEQLRDQRRFSEAMAASQEKYAHDIALASQELEYYRKEHEKNQGRYGSKSKEQTALNNLRNREEALRKLQYQAQKELYDIQVQSVSDEKSVLEERMKTLKTLTEGMLANPLFTDWGRFESLDQQYKEVLSRLIEVVRAEGELRNESPEAIQNQIDALKASGESIYTFAEVYDKAARAFEQYIKSFEVLTAPDLIRGSTDVGQETVRRDYGIQESPEVRLESLRQRQELLTLAIEKQKKALEDQIRQFRELNEVMGETERDQRILAITSTEEALQDWMEQLVEVAQEVRAVSLDIDSALAKAFNVEGIMSDLRATVETTIGDLAQTIRDEFVNLFTGLSNSIVDWMFGDIEGDLGDALDDVAKNFAKNLAKNILNAYLQKAMFTALESVVPGSTELLKPKEKGLADLFQAGFNTGVMNVQAGTVNINGGVGSGAPKGVLPAQVGPAVGNALLGATPSKSQIDAFIEMMAPSYGLDPLLVKALVQAESSYNPRAVSSAGAQGLGQLMPDTAKRFGVKDPFNPYDNLRGSMEYLKFLSDKFKGDVDKILAGYNAGEGAVDRYKGVPPYPETQAYVPKVKGIMAQRAGEPPALASQELQQIAQATQQTAQNTGEIAAAPAQAAVTPEMEQVVARQMEQDRQPLLSQTDPDFMGPLQPREEFNRAANAEIQKAAADAAKSAADAANALAQKQAADAQEAAAQAQGEAAAAAQPALLQTPQAQVTANSVNVSGAVSSLGVPAQAPPPVPGAAPPVEGEAGKSVKGAADAIKEGAQEVKTETRGLVSSLGSYASSAISTFGGFIGSLANILSREFPGVGQVMQGLGIAQTVLGAFGFKKGGVIEEQMPVPIPVIKAAKGAVLEEAKQTGAVRRSYEMGDSGAVVKNFASDQKTLKEKVLAKLGLEQGGEEKDRPQTEEERRTGIAKAAAGKVMKAGRRLKSGLLKGMGTGTSDSIPGVIVSKDGKLQSGIAVSTGEAVLNKSAVDALGAPFINWVNANSKKFASGGVILPPTLKSEAIPLSAMSSASYLSQSAGLDEKKLSQALSTVLSHNGPKSMRLEVSDSALHRTLRDYLEDYFRDVMATR